MSVMNRINPKNVLPSIIVSAFCMAHLASAIDSSDRFVQQSAREIPVLASVDVVVIGGSTAGVAAAAEAADKGAKVFLVEPHLYLGEDLCATLRLEAPEGFRPRTPLAKKLFGDDRTVKPGHVKATLAKHLMDAGVEFCYGSYVTDVLRDKHENPCGVIIANRAGRQAIIAKVMIDATAYAQVGRQAGCEFAVNPQGSTAFARTILQRIVDEKPTTTKKKAKVRFVAKTLNFELKLPDLSYHSIAQAEAKARAITPDEGLLRAADAIFCVPPVPIQCRTSLQDSTPQNTPALTCFQPKGARHIYVLSGCADIPRATAAELLQPGALIATGIEIGDTAAADARALPVPESPHLQAAIKKPVAVGDIKELLDGVRSPPESGPAFIKTPATSIPVLDEVDVLVIGGGTSGTPAAIAAAREGARALVVEYQSELGGVGTLGQISKPYHGKKIGFAEEVPFPKEIEKKMAWYRSELQKSGGTALMNTLGCGAFVDGNTVKGAVVCTPEGRGVILARVVIDATGSADTAIAAGADYLFGAIEKGDIALQGTGLSPRIPGTDFNNTDHMLVDEADLSDLWRALVSTSLINKSSYDVGSLILTRERRRVVGDHIMRYIDQIAGRTYPDSIVYSGSDYDSHGYPSSPFFMLLPHDAKSRKANHPAPGGTCYTPYRSLLPAGLEGIIVAGLGISMDRDASAMVRMQLDMANQGYAAGVAASMAVKDKITPRTIDVHTLQKHLVQTGALKESVLTQQDSFPLSIEEIQQAVTDYGQATNPASAGKSIAVILSHPDKAIPLVKQAYQNSNDRPRLLYAQMLGALGEKDGVPTLLNALKEITAWDAKINQGFMSPFAYLPTPQDSIILALGYSADPAAAPALIPLVDKLDQSVTLSHHRSLALALENLKDPSAAKPLAELLKKPGMSGYAMHSVATTKKTEMRTESLREITLARALYRCGDHQGLGRKILKEYQTDLRGLFSRHAQQVLTKRAGE